MRYDSDVLYRPPGEWKSYLLQCTIGCSYNKCTFCAMYKGKQFRIRPVAVSYTHLDVYKRQDRWSCRFWTPRPPY